MIMIKKLFKCVLIALLINVMCVNVFADQDYIGKSGTILIEIKDGAKKIDGVNYSLFKVATLDNKELKYIVTSEFDDLSQIIESINILETVNYSDYYEEVLNCIEENEIEPYKTGTTIDGQVSFTVPVGLYFLVGEKTLIDDEDGMYYYTPQNTFVTIPASVDEKSEGLYEYNYNALIQSKWTKTQRTIDIKVVKTFDDLGYVDHRPDQILVQLYKDGVEDGDPVALNSSNSFVYTFENLDARFTWTVKELEIKNYKSSQTTEQIDVDEYRIDIVNKYIPPIDNPPGDNPPADNPPGDKPILPSTGVLWWPVPMLGTLGLMFVTIGKYRERKSEK